MRAVPYGYKVLFVSKSVHLAAILVNPPGSSNLHRVRVKSLKCFFKASSPVKYRITNETCQNYIIKVTL